MLLLHYKYGRNMHRYFFSIILFSSLLFAQSPVLTQNNAYMVTGASVTEGKFKAFATADGKLYSNYTPAFQENYQRLLTFKFAINGIDNEAAPGTDHKVYLNPVKGAFVTPLFTFGGKDPVGADMPQGGDNPIPPHVPFQVTFRVNMQPVLSAFAQHGYFTDYQGRKITREEFTGVFIAGGSEPLSWDFAALPHRKQFQLHDSDGDGIYEITLQFENTTGRVLNAEGFYEWQSSGTVANFPLFSSSSPLLNSVYTLSLEEMLQNIRPDGAFMAGAKWDGVWTRDISYSIMLSLAIIHPDACKTSLRAKVKNGIIIQDTGTGGSWPVSTDRMVWALAAYEVYLTTGDTGWLAEAYAIINKSLIADEFTVRDEQTGLMKGESSFLDWREQTYPRWMQPVSIYASQCLGTNAVYVRMYQILAAMAAQLKLDAVPYHNKAQALVASMNKHLWIERSGYYGQFLYGDKFPVLSPRSEALGQSLSVLFNIAGSKAASVVRNMPTTIYGTPVVFPQDSTLPPYHNNAVWPFVEAFRMLAAKKVHNKTALAHSMGSILRGAAMFLTNKENLVASTGSCQGTEINSDRQLWSVAGSLAIAYRVLFGMEFLRDTLVLSPYVPKGMGPELHLKNFTYGNGVYDITILGEGDHVGYCTLDGKPLTTARLVLNNPGKHVLKLTLQNRHHWEGKQQLVKNRYAPSAPIVQLTGNTFVCKNQPQAAEYRFYKNGKLKSSSRLPELTIVSGETAEDWQVSVVDASGNESFLSAPQLTGRAVAIIPAVSAGSTENFVYLTGQPGEECTFQFVTDTGGVYSVEFYYANGNGPINTDNKCAIRTLRIDGKERAPIVMPQRGVENWKEYGYSNAVLLPIQKGAHTASLSFTEINTNMNMTINTVRIAAMRLCKIK